MAGMKPINTSIFDFPGMITGGYVYVDKTGVGESRPVYYVGVNYDPRSRTIDDVKAEAA